MDFFSCFELAHTTSFWTCFGPRFVSRETRYEYLEIVDRKVSKVLNFGWNFGFQRQLTGYARIQIGTQKGQFSAKIDQFRWFRPIFDLIDAGKIPFKTPVGSRLILGRVAWKIWPTPWNGYYLKTKHGRKRPKSICTRRFSPLSHRLCFSAVLICFRRCSSSFYLLDYSFVRNHLMPIHSHSRSFKP